MQFLQLQTKKVVVENHFMCLIISKFSNILLIQIMEIYFMIPKNQKGTQKGII